MGQKLPTGKELGEILVTVRMPRSEWLILETVLVAFEMRAERKRKNREPYQQIAARVKAIKLAIIQAERKKAKELYRKKERTT